MSFIQLTCTKYHSNRSMLSLYNLSTKNLINLQNESEMWLAFAELLQCFVHVID